MLTTHKNMQSVASKFNSSQNKLHLEVKIKTTTTSIYEDMAITPVDLVFINLMDTTIVGNHMVALDNYLQSENKLRSTYNRLRESTPYKRIYALPVTRKPLTVYVHNDTLKKVGMSPATNWTWDEFYVWVTRLASSKLHRYGTSLGLPVWAAPFIQLGGSMQGPFDKAEYGLRIIKKIQDTLDAHAPVHSIGYGGNSHLFISREVASCIDAISLSEWLIQLGYLPGKAGWRTLPLPNVDGKQVGVSISDSHYGISANSRKKDQAWSVLRWLMLEEGSKALVEAGCIPYNIYPSVIVALQNYYGATSKDVFPQDIRFMFTPYIDPERPSVALSNQYLSAYFKGFISVQEAIAGMNASVGASLH